MRKCVVPGCHNSQQKKELRGITFHRIPKKAKRRSSWLQAIGFPPDYLVGDRTVICSAHFAEDCFDRTSINGLIRLRENATPTIISTMETHSDETGDDSDDDICYLYVDEPTSRVQMELSEDSGNSLTEFECSISKVQLDNEVMRGIYKDIENQKLKQQLSKITARYKASQIELRNLKRNLERKKHKISVMKSVIQQLTRERVVNE